MSRKSKKKKQDSDDKLQEIYDSLPTVACKGLCHESCGVIPMTAKEFDNVTKLLKNPVSEEHISRPTRRKVVIYTPDLKCPVLTVGQCGAYEARPMICRLFGVVDDQRMRCPHGCEPSRWLKFDDVVELVAAVEKLK